MYILKTNTATRIAVGPLVDPTDGKTAETGLTVTDLSVQLYQIKNDGKAVVRTQFAPTASGGNNDMALVASSTDGMYDLELTAAQLNWLGNGRISFYDVDGFLVHWIDIQVVSAAYFDWIFGTTIPEVNTTKIGGTTQTGRDIGASVLLSSGTGPGQLDFTSGVVKSNLAQILGTALTETAGYLAAAFKKFFNVETPVLTCESVNQTIDNPTAAAIGTDAASKVLVTPAQKIVTDVNGYVSANVKSQDNIDFGALQKASITAATNEARHGN